MIVTMMDAVLGLVRAERQVAALTQRQRIGTDTEQDSKRGEIRGELNANMRLESML